MKPRIIAIIVTVLVLAAALVYWQRSKATSPPAGSTDIPGNSAAPEPAKPDTAARPERMSAAPDIVADDDPPGPLRLEGQVIDAGEVPVAGAVVTLGSNPPRTAITEGDGSFAFDKLVPRVYQLRAHKDDEVGGPVVHELTASSEPVVIRVTRGATLDVLVVDEDSAPLSGAIIELRQGAPRSETTDQDGKARFRGLASGFVILAASAPGRGVVHHPVEIPAEIAAGATVKTRIVMHQGAVVAGKVVTEDGKPVAGARVVARDASALLSLDNPRRDGVVTDNQGRFDLGLRSQGTYRFTATHPDHAPASTAPIAVDGVTEMRDIEIVVKEGGVLSGKVVDETGQPVPFATVRIMPARGVSPGLGQGERIRQASADERGGFRITGLARVALSVMAVSETASSNVASVDLGPVKQVSDVVLSLTVAGIIAGQVVDSAGEPVAEAQVTAFPDFWGGAPADDFLLRGMSAVITDGGGRFELKGLPAGDYRLRASRSRMRTVEYVRPGVQATTGQRDVTLVLAQPGRLEGVVQFDDGKAVQAFTVTVGLPPGAPVMDERGAFSLGELPPGTYDVTFRGSRFAPRTVRGVEVSAGATKDMGTIEVKRGRSVSGRVLDAGGYAVSGASVIMARQLMGDGKTAGANIGAGGQEFFGVQRATSDQDGYFYLDGLGAGEQQLVAEHDDKGRCYPVTIPAGTTNLVYDLELRPFGSAYGVVTRNREPAAGVPVIASPKGAGKQMLIVRTGQDGSYVFDRLPAGPHRITATLGENNMVSASSAGTDVMIKEGRKVESNIDITLGDIEYAVYIAGQDGATIDAAQVFLIPGQAAPRTAKELTQIVLQSSQGGVQQTLAMGTDKAAFKNVSPGEYSVCIIPINGDMNDVSFQMRLQQHVDQLAVHCAVRAVNATPGQQEYRAVVPPMTPLPGDEPAGP